MRLRFRPATPDIATERKRPDQKIVLQKNPFCLVEKSETEKEVRVVSSFQIVLQAGQDIDRVR
jgi:hypothetical protein